MAPVTRSDRYSNIQLQQIAPGSCIKINELSIEMHALFKNRLGAYLMGLHGVCGNSV